MARPGRGAPLLRAAHAGPVHHRPVAGRPKRPQDRVALSDAKESFREALGNYVQLDRLDEDVADTFPASDPFTADRENGDADQPAGRPVASGSAARPTPPR